MAQSRVLESGPRQRILDAVQADPGATPRGLARALQRSVNSVAYHVRVLQRRQRLVVVRRGRHVHCFLTTGPFVNGAKDVIIALRAPGLVELLRAIVATPGITPKELAERTLQAPASISWRMRRALETGLACRTLHGRRTYYWPGPATEANDLSAYGLGRPRP